MRKPTAKKDDSNFAGAAEASEAAGAGRAKRPREKRDETLDEKLQRLKDLEQAEQREQVLKQLEEHREQLRRLADKERSLQATLQQTEAAMLWLEVERQRIRKEIEEIEQKIENERRPLLCEDVAKMPEALHITQAAASPSPLSFSPSPSVVEESDPAKATSDFLAKISAQKIEELSLVEAQALFDEGEEINRRLCVCIAQNQQNIDATLQLWKEQEAQPTMGSYEAFDSQNEQAEQYVQHREKLAAVLEQIVLKIRTYLGEEFQVAHYQLQNPQTIQIPTTPIDEDSKPASLSRQVSSASLQEGLFSPRMSQSQGAKAFPSP